MMADFRADLRKLETLAKQLQEQIKRLDDVHGLHVITVDTWDDEIKILIDNGVEDVAQALGTTAKPTSAGGNYWLQIKRGEIRYTQLPMISKRPEYKPLKPRGDV